MHLLVSLCTVAVTCGDVMSYCLNLTSQLPRPQLFLNCISPFNVRTLAVHRFPKMLRLTFLRIKSFNTHICTFTIATCIRLRYKWSSIRTLSLRQFAFRIELTPLSSLTNFVTIPCTCTSMCNTYKKFLCSIFWYLPFTSRKSLDLAFHAYSIQPHRRCGDPTLHSNLHFSFLYYFHQTFLFPTLQPLHNFFIRSYHLIFYPLSAPHPSVSNFQ